MPLKGNVVFKGTPHGSNRVNGLFDFDLAAAIFGQMSLVSRIVYVLVSVPAPARIVPLIKATRASC